MFVLTNGQSTGEILNSISSSGVNIITAQYSVEECSHGIHYHEDPQICFLFHGMDLESRKNDLYERKAGDLYFYHAGEKHGAISRKGVSKNMVIEFGTSFLQTYDASEYQINEAVNNKLDAKFLILKMQQEMSQDDDCSQLAIQMLLLDLINCSKSSSSKPEPKWVQLLADLLNDRWNEQVTLNELSMATAVHPATISKHFRKYFSCTLGEYLRKLKIDRSIPLIKNSPMSLTDIAFHCGFTDQSHFTRNFKQLTGFLPKEFRNM